jgi:ABC-type lipoprotein release transport system permease subunit
VVALCDGPSPGQKRGRDPGVVVKGVDHGFGNRGSRVWRARVIEGEWETWPAPRPLTAKVEPLFFGQRTGPEPSVGMGDRLILAVPTAENVGMGNLPFFFSFTVAGILQTGLYDYDSSLAVVGLPTAQKIFNLKGRYSGLGFD